MTREKIINSMSLQDAIQVFKDTNCYGTMDIAKSVILKALEQEPTTQERQAETDKFDAAFQDGYNNGYAQARFDYEQEPTTKNDSAAPQEPIMFRIFELIVMFISGMLLGMYI